MNGNELATPLTNIFEDENLTVLGGGITILDKYIEEAKTEHKPIEFVATICPDYSYTMKNGVARYTFDNVGESAGLVAEGMMQSILPLATRLEEEGIHNRITFTYADTESLDPDICLALGISQVEFEARLEKSALCLFHRFYTTYQQNNLVHFSIPSVAMMSDVIRQDVREECISQLKTVKESSIDGIALDRNPLYIKWFKNHPELQQKSTSSAFIEKRVKKDILDHFLLAESLRRSSSNIAILSMSNPKLGRYFNYSGNYPHIPVILVDKNY